MARKMLGGTLIDLSIIDAAPLEKKLALKKQTLG